MAPLYGRGEEPRSQGESPGEMVPSLPLRTDESVGEESVRDKWARITLEMEQDLLGEEKKKRTGPNWLMFTPIFWAPVFPIIRLTFRNNATVRVRAFAAAIGLANVHAFYIMNDPDGELFAPRKV
ncbi:hypothetical protein T492DRAFT_919364 [Pavlovales sp. CCMP2436]|nr:hypothetical protein T492DRAFT_919364 [Pavlovales sp. CCMP2436]